MKHFSGSPVPLVALSLVLSLCLGGLSPATLLADEPVARVSAAGLGLDFEPRGNFDSIELRVRGPQGHYEAQLDPGFDSWQATDVAGQTLPDGVYTYELSVGLHADGSLREQMARARETGTEEAFLRSPAGRALASSPTQTGYFQIRNGEIVLGGDDEPQRAARASEAASNPDKTTISGDLSVYNSLCVGLDCLTAESYGADTIRLKENNLRIHFDDTSAAAGFAATDWRIEVNSSLSGGGGYFAIQDATAGRIPFLIEAGAASNSLYVDTGSRVGIGTSTPALNLHVVSGNTPALRLEQNASSGFAPQTWDLSGNETNFFLRDVTSGSRLPLRVRPGAPSSALDISASGDIGIGTGSPSEDIHLVRAAVPVGVKLEDSSSGRDWTFKLSGSGFAISEEAEASTLLLRDNGEMRVGNNGAAEFVVDPNGNTSIDGNLSVTGNITATGTISDRNRKQQIVQVEGGELLAKVLTLPVSTWVYDHQSDVRHIGPMAQDFHQAFGLGTEESIGLTDLGGLSLAAIQELNAQFEQRLEAKDAQIEEMQQRLAALEAALLELQQR